MTVTSTTDLKVATTIYLCVSQSYAPTLLTHAINSPHQHIILVYNVWLFNIHSHNYIKKVDTDVSSNIKIFRMYMAGTKKNKQECLIFTVVPSRKKRKGDKKKRKVTGQQKIHEIYSEESVSKKKSETWLVTLIMMILIVSNGNNKIKVISNINNEKYWWYWFY